MAAPIIHSQSVVVVLLGSFNPRIVEPLWLSKHSLVPEEEASGAEREMIDRDFSRIVLPWAELVVFQERLQIDTREKITNAAQVRDLLVGILRILPHTPVTVASINHRALLRLDTEEQWHEVGHRLAPKDVWDGVLDKPGMLDFAMQGVRPDGLDGAIKVRIRPNPLVHPGLFINVNDEFSLPDQNDPEPAARAAGLLAKSWSEIEARADHICSTLLKRLVD